MSEQQGMQGGMIAEMDIDSRDNGRTSQDVTENPVTATYTSLCAKQKAGRSTAWGATRCCQSRLNAVRD